MNPLGRVNALLAGMIVALAALLWWGQPPDDDQPGTERLSSLAATQIHQIQILEPGSALRIRLEKTAMGWQLSQPIQAPADALSVTELLAIAQQPVLASYPASSLDLAGLGLAPPRWRLRLDELDLAIGDTEPLSQRRYLQQGDMVHLVNELPLERLDLDYSDLVSRRLVPPGLTISAIILGERRIDDPGLLARWQQTQAVWLDHATAADYAQGQPIQLQHDAGHIAWLRLPADRGLLRIDWDLVYRLPPSAYAELLPPDA